MKPMQLLKLAEVKQRTGYSRSTLYSYAQHGLFTRPVKIGERASAWPDYEVTAITQARMAGKRKEEIVRLVNRLHLIRKQQAANGEIAQ